jgi:hypothetical protein
VLFTLAQGYDVKLRGRVSRYRIVKWEAEGVIVQRFHRTRMRPHGKQQWEPMGQVEALCIGQKEDGGPSWAPIKGFETLPRLPGVHAQVILPGGAEFRRAIAEIDSTP